MRSHPGSGFDTPLSAREIVAGWTVLGKQERLLVVLEYAAHEDGDAVVAADVRVL